ncbi:CPBP family intramembrane glutamic endopeptidase [Intrasporangium sp.]|uniref:CPBP family intramembrane glutamic endopeptidase n=1 Tax=Intrasporangium sp. TaxID=1925024 RepID=UPI002939693F|nr:CPBP family intramembrane glutamic endopeptidase [Intrasporangium sp.]MDV3222268.1 CPBP family intramembrane metalloprotease [Intrasporangium sp.]
MTRPSPVSRPGLEALLAYAVFSGLSLLSRFVAPVFLLVVVSGIAIPLLWARRTRDWAAIGFTRRNVRPALAWGLAAGAVGAAVTVLMARIDPFPEPVLPGAQLIVGIPLWLLIMSPFQEFFFRGWLQPRLVAVLGVWKGIVVTTVLFAVWHFLAPFQNAPGALLDLTTVISVLTMLGMGLAFGAIFQRTGNIVAPWLGHALMGIALVAVGGMTFLQYS